MQRPIGLRLWYCFLHFVTGMIGVTGFQIRIYGRHHEPAKGSTLVLSNHQSHLDPVIIGFSCRRRLNFLARETLFKFAPFRWLIESVDAIPIDREGLGLAGIKEALKRLKRGEMVLIFPEGTRSRNGEVGAMKPGFCMLARRGRSSLLPVGIAGSYDAYPRWRLVPRPAMIHVRFGDPITKEQMADLTDDQLVAEVQRRIVRCHREATASLRLAKGRAIRSVVAD